MQLVLSFAFFMGDDNSGLGAYLASKFPTRFRASDIFGDYCVIVSEFRNTNDDIDNDAGESYIPFQGLPEVRVELSGAKVCDPRISGYDYADESTYVYSDNAALIDAQFDYGWYSGSGANRALIVGNGYPLDILDIDQISNNADYCAAESYTCAGLLQSGQPSDQEEIWKCYNADRVEYAAKIYSVPEGDRNTFGTIDLSEHLAAHVSFFDEHGFSTEVYNEVLTKYAEPEEYYAEIELDPYTNSEWIAADDHIPRQMDLPLLFVTDKVQAAKLQKEEIYISRAASTCRIDDLPFNYISVRVGDTVTITNSDVEFINGKTWIVKARSQTARGDVGLFLRLMADAEAFGYDLIAEPVAPPITTPIVREWDSDDWPGTKPHINKDLVIAIRDGEYIFPNLLVQGRGSVSDTLDVHDFGIDGLRVEISTSGGGLTITCPTYITGEVTSASAIDVTTDQITASASGGNGGPYTYAWSKVSGETFTINSPSSASTTFTATLVPAGHSRSAQYKVTVSDGTNTSEKYVTVYAGVIDPNNDFNDGITP